MFKRSPIPFTLGLLVLLAVAAFVMIVVWPEPIPLAEALP